VGPRQKPKRRFAVALLVLFAALALAAFTQQAAAARLGELVADLWVSAMSVVLSMIGALFGVH